MGDPGGFAGSVLEWAPCRAPVAAPTSRSPAGTEVFSEHSGQQEHLYPRTLRRPRRARPPRRRCLACREVAPRTGREACPTEYTNEWEIGVVYGPHGAPDFFTHGDIEVFFSTAWKVHYNSDRTGVRLIGPKPTLGSQGRRRSGAAPFQYP